MSLVSSRHTAAAGVIGIALRPSEDVCWRMGMYPQEMLNIFLTVLAIIVSVLYASDPLP